MYAKFPKFYAEFPRVYAEFPRVNAELHRVHTEFPRVYAKKVKNAKKYSPPGDDSFKGKLSIDNTFDPLKFGWTVPLNAVLLKRSVEFPRVYAEFLRVYVCRVSQSVWKVVRVYAEFPR